MKVLCTSDWHIRYNRPRNRKDENYFDTILYKINWILDQTKNYDIILQAGDMFDTWKISHVPYFLTKILSEIFLEKIWDKGKKIFSVVGQHDQRYRCGLSDSPLSVLEVAEIVWIAKEEELGDGVVLYGCGYGEEVPSPKSKEDFNILLIHKMITEDGPLWPGQTDYISGKAFLKKYPYDLVISGDNHQSFISTYRDKTLINCGSLMRSNVDQISHIPCAYIFDTDTRKYEKLEIPVEPAFNVLKIQEAVYDKGQKSRIDSLVLGLEEKGGNVELDYYESAKIEKEEIGLDEEVWEVFVEAYESCKKEI